MPTSRPAGHSPTPAANRRCGRSSPKRSTTALEHANRTRERFRDDERLIRLATLAVRCRSAVERDGYSREIVRIPDAEAPGRLALVLRRILDALAVIGCDEQTAWQIVTKVALDSMERPGVQVIEQLLAKPGSGGRTVRGRGARLPDLDDAAHPRRPRRPRHRRP